MLKTINELNNKLQELVEKGYGDKPIYLNAFSCEQGKSCEINSIQKNTNPDIEPDYFFFMEGEEISDEQN